MKCTQELMHVRCSLCIILCKNTVRKVEAVHSPYNCSLPMWVGCVVLTKNYQLAAFSWSNHYNSTCIICLPAYGIFMTLSTRLGCPQWSVKDWNLKAEGFVIADMFMWHLAFWASCYVLCIQSLMPKGLRCCEYVRHDVSWWHY